MLLIFTEVSTKQPVAINPTTVSSVFSAPEGEYAGKTVIAVSSQPILVEESFTEVVGQLNGALK